MFHPTPAETGRATPRGLGLGRRAVIGAHEVAVLFRDGVAVGTFGPGAHRWFGRGLALRRVDVRPFVHVVPSQEVPTADGVTVKLTAAVRARVADAEAFVVASQDPLADLHLTVQVALREVVAERTVEDLLQARAEVRTALAAQVGDLSGVGLEVPQIEVKDIVLPHELRHARAQVLLARAEGEAALERARGEGAALRSLANTARLATDTPALLQLRLIQELGAGSGHTVVIGTPPMAPVAGGG